MMLDTAVWLVIIGTAGKLGFKTSVCEAGDKAAMVWPNEHRYKAISAMCVVGALLLVMSGNASAGLIVSCDLSSADGLSAAGGQADKSHEGNLFSRLIRQKQAVFSLLSQGDGRVSTTGAGPSTGSISSTTLAVACGSNELPELEPRGYIAGALTPVVPLPPLFDFLRPPRT